MFAAMAEVDRFSAMTTRCDGDAWRGPSARRGAGVHSASAIRKIAVADIMAVRETAPHLMEGFKGLPRAFVQVQNGCDHRCTFCIIPFGRGNSRSVPMGAVVDKCARLVDNGHRRIVLTGVDITSTAPICPARRNSAAGEADLRMCRN
jgi:threonylcarbamoyladenosine tRNA methylthiotransferase MtaB